MPLRRSILAIAAFVLIVALIARGNDGHSYRDLSEIRIGILPDQGAEQLRARYTPLFQYLSEETGLSYVLIIPETYQDLLQLFEDKKVDLAYFGGLTYLQANQVNDAIPLVMRDVDANFTSFFLVPPDSPASRIQDLEGRVLSFGSRLSTSGHLMPRMFMREQGVEPEQFFGSVRYSGSHDKTAFEVRDGQADLGASNAEVVRAMFEDGRLTEGDVRILWETPPFPDYVWAVQPYVRPGTQEALRQTFLKLSRHDERHSSILDLIGAGAFLPAADQDFDPLRKVAKELDLVE